MVINLLCVMSLSYDRNIIGSFSMLNKTIPSTNAVIPFTNSVYGVTRNGEILKSTGPFTPPELVLPDSYGMVCIEFNFGDLVVNILNLIQVSFKPVFYQDFKFYLTTAKVISIDADPKNRTPENLIWQLGISHVKKGLYRIPGFSYYLINKEGQVYDRIKKTFLTNRPHKEKYVQTPAKPDYLRIDNKWCVRPVHRLLAMAFLPYGRDVCELDVNHINGDKHDYRLSNLEWSTRSENNMHAQMIGLKRDSLMLNVTNLETGDVTHFHSQGDCARAMGLTASKISWRLINGNGEFIDNGYLFSRPINNSNVKYKSAPKQVILVNPYTGEQREFISLAKTAEFLGLTNSAVKKRFSRGSHIYGQWVMFTYNPSLGEAKPKINIEELKNTYVKSSRSESCGEFSL